MLRQISSTMVGTKGKMYTEIKVKERRFLEFRNKRKERQKQPQSSIKLQTGDSKWFLLWALGEWGCKWCVTGTRIQAYRSREILLDAHWRTCFWRRCEFTWFCVTNLKSSFRGCHMNSRKHLFCTSGCISSINLRFSGLYPLTELSWIKADSFSISWILSKILWNNSPNNHGELLTGTVPII